MKITPKTEQITGDAKPRLSLYELMGLSVNPYRQQSLDEYKAYIEDLSFIDLHQHAAEEAGVVPIDDREKLIERLTKQYIIVHGQLEAARIQVHESKKQLDNQDKRFDKLTPEKRKQLKEFLARGR